jgi:hypothetical protein
MKMTSKRQKSVAKEGVTQGQREWLIVAAVVASLLLIFVGVRLIIR